MDKIISRTKEKIELANEIGMGNWADDAIKEINRKKAVNDLTAMKFNPTNEKTIEKKICKNYWGIVSLELSPWSLLVIPAILSIVFGIVFSAGLLIVFSVNISFPVGMLFVLQGIALLARCFWLKPILQKMALKSWRDPIPYGAMLAVKEAKEKGIKVFDIYYPVKADSKRLFADPVITGFYNGVLVEVFSWDDGKIYE